MANGIRTDDPHWFNKGCSSKFREGSQVRKTPEEGRRTYRPKSYGNNNKDEENSPKSLKDENNSSISKNVCLFPYPWGYDYMDACLQSSWEDVALEVTV